MPVPDYCFTDACKDIGVDPHKALYSLREFYRFTPYSLATIRKFAYGDIPNTGNIKFRKDKYGRYCVIRPDVIDYLHSLRLVNSDESKEGKLYNIPPTESETS